MACTTVDCLPPITGRESIPLVTPLVLGSLENKGLKKCGLCPITLHFSRPLIGGRHGTVVQIYIHTCIHTYIHIHTYINKYKHTYVNAC